MYSTTADIERLLAPDVIRQLTDDGPNGRSADEIIAEAIDQADREIDSYVGVVRQVPLDPAPGLVANLSAKIAAYNLLRRRPHLEAGEWGDEYKRCLRLLERVAAGQISLGAVSADEPAPAMEPAGAAVVTPPAIFTDLEDY